MSNSFESPPPPDPPESLGDLFTDSSPPDGAAKGRSETPSAISFNEAKVFWAMRNMPVGEATKHFFICGTAGSGKTTVIQLFLQSIAPRVRQGRAQPERLIVFDAKGEIVPALAAIGLRPEDENVWILNPFDARGASWNLAEAVQAPPMARFVAKQLVPEERHSVAPFFADAARTLVFNVILALNQIAGSRWTLRDLLCALDSLPRIRAITARHATAKADATRFLDAKDRAPSVLSTLATNVSRFEEVAAHWHNAKRSRKFSVSEFLAKPGVLILGNDPLLREGILPINAILLRALTNEILGQPDTSSPCHWFVFDEFRALGQVAPIHDLLSHGRSKGVSVLIGAQAVEGLMETYGEQGANDIIAQCAHKTFLRVGGPKSAECAEDLFGHRENVLVEWWGEDGQFFSTQRRVEQQPLFRAGLFLDLPSPALGRPVISISQIPSVNANVVSRVPFNELLAWSKPPAPDIPAAVSVSDSRNQVLRPWSEGEERAFCGDGIQ